MLKNRIIISLAVLVILILISACTNHGSWKSVDNKTVLKDIQKITAELLNVKKSKEG